MPFDTGKVKGIIFRYNELLVIYPSLRGIKIPWISMEPVSQQQSMITAQFMFTKQEPAGSSALMEKSIKAA